MMSSQDAVNDSSTVDPPMTSTTPTQIEAVAVPPYPSSSITVLIASPSLISTLSDSRQIVKLSRLEKGSLSSGKPSLSLPSFPTQATFDFIDMSGLFKKEKDSMRKEAVTWMLSDESLFWDDIIFSVWKSKDPRLFGVNVQYASSFRGVDIMKWTVDNIRRLCAWLKVTGYRAKKREATLKLMAQHKHSLDVYAGM